MKKLIATIILTLTVVASSFAWETFAEYEMFCFANGIEPSYEEFEYYASEGGQCYATEDAEIEIENILAMAKE